MVFVLKKKHRNIGEKVGVLRDFWNDVVFVGISGEIPTRFCLVQ